MLYSYPALVDVFRSLLMLIAFSASNLKVNTLSVVLLTGSVCRLCFGILFDSFCLILLIVHMAKFMAESRMMGLRFAGGPCGFPGLRRGTSIPSFSSSGYSPDLSMLLNISAFQL